MLMPLGGTMSTSMDPGFGFMRLLNDIMSDIGVSPMNRDFLGWEPEVKYDVIKRAWTKNCSDVTMCEHGVYENEDRDDVCPSCYVTINEVCGKWYGECEPEELTCKYDDVTYKGRCVPKSAMTSLDLGEKCGDVTGTCREDLRCQHDADPMTSFVSVTGYCVTNETFNQRQEGQTCGEKIGGCHGDLVCMENLFTGQRFCREEEKSPECDTQMPFGGVEMIIEFDGEDKNGVHKHMEFVGDGSALPQQLVEEIPMLSLLGEVVGEGLLPNGEDDRDDQKEKDCKDDNDDQEENDTDSESENEQNNCENVTTEADEAENDENGNFALTPKKVYDDQNKDEEDVDEDREKRGKEVVEPEVVELNRDTSNKFDNINSNEEGVQGMHK